MVTVITKKYCHMFNMTNHSQELELCAFFQRMRGRAKDQNKIIKIDIKKPNCRLKVYKILISNIEKVMWEERTYDVNDGFYINKFINKYEHKVLKGEINE